MPRSPVLSKSPRRTSLILAAATATALLPLVGIATFNAQAAVPTSVAPVAEKLIDAVVNISTSQTIKGTIERRYERHDLAGEIIRNNASVAERADRGRLL